MATFKHTSGDTVTVKDDSKAAKRLDRLGSWSRTDAAAGSDDTGNVDAGSGNSETGSEPTGDAKRTPRRTPPSAA